jgi:hypothetical protein
LTPVWPLSKLPIPSKRAEVAQLVEQLIRNQ